MAITRQRIYSRSGEIRTPPRELQLWQRGENPTDYGVHKWTERSIASVLARYNERGNPILIDVEHNGAQLPDGKPAATGGYCKLEIRAGTPYLIFDWSEFGKQQIESGQRRFLSPEYDVDKNTGEILALYRVSLVADPGTHRARMLASASNGAKTKMDLQVILAALRAALAAEDPAVAKESITNLLAELEKSGGSGDPAPAATDAPTDPAPTDPAMASADDDKDEDKDKMAAAAPAKPAETVAGAAASAVLQIKAAQRDHLLATQGDKVEPSIRRWLSSCPLEIVQGYLAAKPAPAASVERASATRGAPATEHGLSERELAKCKAKGIDPAKYAANIAAMTGKVA